MGTTAEVYVVCVCINMAIMLVWYTRMIVEGPFKKVTWNDVKYNIIDIIIVITGPIGSIGLCIAIYGEIRTWRKFRGWSMNVNDPKWKPALDKARAQFEIWEAEAGKSVEVN